MVSAIGIAFWVDYFGRRPIFLTSCVGMILCFVSTTIALARFQVSSDDGVTNNTAAHAVIAFIFLYYISYNIGFSGMLVSYSSEILPYHIRAKGLTLMFFCVDCSLWFNQYVNPIAIDHIQWKYYIVYCVFLVFEFFVVWKFYIETKETPLEEIAKHFDGESAVVGGLAGTEKARAFAVDETAQDEKAISSSVEPVA